MVQERGAVHKKRLGKGEEDIFVRVKCGGVGEIKKIEEGIRGPPAKSRRKMLRSP